MRKSPHFRKQSPEQKILANLLDELTLVTWVMQRPANFRFAYIQRGLARGEWEQIQKNKRQKQAIRDLNRKAWLDARKEGDKIVCRLSKDAIIARLKQAVRSSKTKLPRGERCLVLFDIPVGANTARNFWRYFLATSGFKRDQLSAWVTDKDVVDAIRALIRLLRAEQWMRVYRILS